MEKKSRQVAILASITAGLIALLSAFSLLWPKILYQTEDEIVAYLSNDAANLLIALPAVWVSAWLVLKNKIFGLLLLPGAVLNIFYNTIVQFVGLSYSFRAIPYLAILVLCIIVLIRSTILINGDLIKSYIAGKVLERLIGGMLAGFGLAFFGMAAGEVVQSITSNSGITSTQAGLHIADLVIAIPWIAGGLALFRKTDLGYRIGGGLSAHAILTFFGLLVLLIVRPFVISMPFDGVEFLTVLAMAAPVFIAFGIFQCRIIRLLNDNSIY